MVTPTDRAHADFALMVRIAGRDASAVGELYDRHSRVLFALICRILRDEGESEDVLQEVFLRVWDKAESYDPVLGSPTAWLVRIARNRAIDRIRARQARPASQSADETLNVVPADEQGTPDPERSAALSEEQRAIAEALSRIPPEQRILIEQAFFQGYTQSELAAKFQLPLGTVKTRIRTGMIAMRDHLQHLV
jgi:RNA polymerase sigma-70 factor (ECF subfamily)